MTSLLVDLCYKVVFLFLFFLPIFIFLKMMFSQNDKTSALKSPRNKDFLRYITMVGVFLIFSKNFRIDFTLRHLFKIQLQ